MEKHVRFGDVVRIHFNCFLEDGSLLETSYGGEPLIFKVGQGEVILGLEEAVIGMKLFQVKRINISADKAYGPIEKDLIVNINRKKLPKNIKLRVNQSLEIPVENLSGLTVKVKEITSNSIVLDGNHPLAGENLTLELELLEIIK